jgi:general secretion pathway protein B
VPALQDLPAALQDALPKLRLEVLVYADAAAERMVFINARKYVEGQTIEGAILLERITPTGAVLSHQGQRFLLRQ